MHVFKKAFASVQCLSKSQEPLLQVVQGSFCKEAQAAQAALLAPTDIFVAKGQAARRFIEAPSLSCHALQ